MARSGWNGTGGHRYGEGLSLEEATAIDRARRARIAAAPETVERQGLIAEGERLRQARERNARRQNEGLIGPPNPYRPHRKRDPPG